MCISVSHGKTVQVGIGSADDNVIALFLAIENGGVICRVFAFVEIVLGSRKPTVYLNALRHVEDGLVAADGPRICTLCDPYHCSSHAEFARSDTHFAGGGIHGVLDYDEGIFP